MKRKDLKRGVVFKYTRTPGEVFFLEPVPDEVKLKFGLTKYDESLQQPSDRPDSGWLADVTILWPNEPEFNEDGEICP